MPKTAFEMVLAGLNEAVEIAEGRADPSTYRVHVPQAVDIKAIRGALGLSQNAFAATFGFPVATLRDWEQGRRQPEPSARMLLKIIEKEPAAVLRALEPA